MNVDGSSFGNPGNAGFGGLIRNNFGEWITGFSGSCGISTSMNAELLAIADGLKLAWYEGFRDVICESDSKTAVTLVQNGVSKVHLYAPLVDHIRSYNSFSWNLSFCHTLREGNACADWLAKQGATLGDSMQIWASCSPQLSLPQLADATGVLRTRD